MRVFILFFKNSFLCHFHHCCSPGSSDCCGKRLVFHIFLRRWAAIFFFPSLCWILYSSDRMEAAACTVVSPTFCPLLDNNYRGVSSHDRSSSPFFSSLCWVFSIYFQALLILVSDFSFFMIQTIFCAQLHLIPTCTSHPTLQTYSAGCITTELLKWIRTVIRKRC
jgi:hypothetical protein